MFLFELSFEWVWCSIAHAQSHAQLKPHVQFLLNYCYTKFSFKSRDKKPYNECGVQTKEKKTFTYKKSLASRGNLVVISQSQFSLIYVQDTVYHHWGRVILLRYLIRKCYSIKGSGKLIIQYNCLQTNKNHISADMKIYIEQSYGMSYLQSQALQAPGDVDCYQGQEVYCIFENGILQKKRRSIYKIVCNHTFHVTCTSRHLLRIPQCFICYKEAPCHIIFFFFCSSRCYHDHIKAY